MLGAVGHVDYLVAIVQVGKTALAVEAMVQIVEKVMMAFDLIVNGLVTVQEDPSLVLTEEASAFVDSVVTDLVVKVIDLTFDLEVAVETDLEVVVETDLESEIQVAEQTVVAIDLELAFLIVKT